MKYSRIDFKNESILSAVIEDDMIIKDNTDDTKITEDALFDLDNINNLNLSKFYITKDEVLFLTELYSEINKYLYEYSNQAISEYDYKDSPIYNPSGITRETLAQIIDRVIELAEEKLEQVEEIKLDRNSEPLLTGKYWAKWDMLRANIQSIVLNEIFLVRRPKYYN